MKLLKTVTLLFLCIWLLLADTERSHAAVDANLIPEYVTAGLLAYKTKGYEAAVQVWFADSPHENAATLASSLIFFKNIEMLAGKYRSYDVLMTKQTTSSNAVYIRMNYDRLPGYILFTSFKRGDIWVLGSIKLDRMQKFGGS